VGNGTLTLPGLGHQRGDRVDVVALHWVGGDPVRTGEAADHAPVDQHEPLAAAVLDTLGAHQAAAGRGPVAGTDIDVLGAQARRAVVAVAPVAERCDARTAVLAREALVLGGPADGSASGSKK
jgi:hypothetical protein